MQHLLRLTRGDLPAETSRPDPEKLISGDPVHRVWNLETRDRLYAGLWHSTIGEWKVDYSEWEYVHILEGRSILVSEDGLETTLNAGDSFVIRPGFRGSWRVVQPTLKDYVILT